MSKTYVGNAFSLSMLTLDPMRFAATRVAMVVVEAHEVPDDAISIVGHADTANVFSGLLGMEVVFNRASIKLVEGDVLYVGQYQGPRLPEGATTLPEGSVVQWVEVTVLGF